MDYVLNRVKYVIGQFQRKAYDLHDFLEGKNLPDTNYRFLSSCCLDGELWLKLRGKIVSNERWYRSGVFIDWHTGEYGLRTHTDKKGVWK